MYLITEHDIDIYNNRLSLIRIRTSPKPKHADVVVQFPEFPEFDAGGREFHQVKRTAYGLRLFSIQRIDGV